VNAHSAVHLAAPAQLNAKRNAGVRAATIHRQVIDKTVQSLVLAAHSPTPTREVITECSALGSTAPTQRPTDNNRSE
jgi:hypothetical protein